MGMFGSGGRTAAYQATGLERPKLGGQLLNLLGMNLLGVDFEGQRLGRAVAQKRNEFMSDLEDQTQPGYSQGPQIGVTVPEAGQTADVPQFQLPQRTRDPININSPNLPALAVQAQRLGIPLTGLLDVLKAQQPSMKVAPDGSTYNEHASNLPSRFRTPQNVNNTIVDTGNPDNENRVIPSEPVKGAMPVYDNRGRVTDWTLPTGARQAIGQASQADTLGKTYGTVFNAPNPDAPGSTSPTLGRDMFGGPGGGGGTGSGHGVGRTLTPGEGKAQEIDYTAGASTIAGAGDARIKAQNTANQYTQAFNAASQLDTNNLTNFKLGTAKILRSLGYQDPDLERFTNTADGYRMLTTQMVLPLAKELGSNPSNRDAKIIQDSMPGLKTPRQTAMVTFASQAALQNKEAARQAFFANYEGPQSKAAMQRAWSASDAAKRSVFQDPIFARLSIEGKPAVTIFPQPYKDGKRYGMFRPGTPYEQIFEVF